MKTLDKLDIKEGLTETEGLALEKLVKQIRKPNMIAVEIGSWKGYSTYYIARAVKGYGDLYAIDTWQGTKGTHDQEVKQKDIYKLFKNNMVKLGVWPVISPIKSDSLIASQKFEKESVDFIFIDADHRYEPFLQDLRAWYPKLKVGGIICGHDWNACYYGKLNKENQGKVNDSLETDLTPDLRDIDNHKIDVSNVGIIKGLYDFFQDKYEIIKNTRVWYVQKISK